MNRMIIGVLILLGVASFAGYEVYASREDGLPKCVAGENEICPSEAWTKTLKKYNEMGAALQAAVPGGYNPNQTGTKFIKIVPPPPAPVVVQPKK